MLYYYADISNEVKGPCSSEELLALKNSGKLSSSSPVCAKGQKEWIELRIVLLSQAETQTAAAPIPTARPTMATAITAPCLLVAAPPSQRSRIFTSEGAMSTYYIHQSNEVKGPYTLGQLRSMWNAGTITGETEFCEEGSEAWHRLKLLIAQLDKPHPSDATQPEPAVASTDGKPARPGPIREAIRLHPNIWLASLTTAIALVVVGAGVGAMKLAPYFSQSPAVIEKSTPRPLPSLFQRRLDAFLITGARLSGITKAGLRYSQFDEEYLSTYAAFESLRSEWPDNYAAGAREEFQAGMRGWQLTRKLWDSSLNAPDLHKTSTLLAALEAYAPGRVFRFPDDPEFIPIKHNLGRIMAVAAEHFGNGERLMPTAR